MISIETLGQEAWAIVRGRELCYFSRVPCSPGSPAIVLLHGWLDNAASFAPLVAECPSLPSYTLEFAGHGHSPHNDPYMGYDLLSYAADVIGFLKALDLNSVILVGHSLGAINSGGKVYH